jgi:alpha-D-ribose 1-methylphosphonate 5-triphosphate synthase subunit PhnH
MLTVSPPDVAEARANGTFEALMWALARPGESRDMPHPGLEDIVETLVDRECTAFADTPAIAAVIAQTGATLGPAERADHLFIETLDTGVIAAVPCGSALYPDDGATIVATASHAGQRLRLTGPGIEGFRDVSLAVPAAFWARRAELCTYPEGFDLFLVDGRSVIGIPRSTLVEVL